MYPPRKQERHCSKINIFSSRLNTTNLSLDFAIYSAISSKMPLIMCSKSEKTQCLHVVYLKQVVQSLFQISHILSYSTLFYLLVLLSLRAHFWLVCLRLGPGRWPLCTPGISWIPCSLLYCFGSRHPGGWNSHQDERLWVQCFLCVKQEPHGVRHP